LLVQTAIFVFKIKNPTARCFFYSLPLLKSFYSLVKGTDLVHLHIAKPLIAFKIYDPWHIWPWLQQSWLHTRSPIFSSAVALGFIIALVIIIIRWIGLYFFYRALSRESEVTYKDAPQLFVTLSKLSKAFGLKNMPKVVLTHKKYATPVIIGIINPTLVISPNLLHKLNSREVKMLLAHELAHIKRKDNLLHWFIMGIRDFLFFNPLAHFIVRLIIREKEKAADLLAVKTLDANPESMVKVVSSVWWFLQERHLKPMPSGGTSLTTNQLEITKGKTTHERIKWLRVFNKETNLSVSKLILYFVLLTIFYWIQLIIAFPFLNKLYIIN